MSQDRLQVTPENTAHIELSVRNTGAVVDSFALSVLGEAANWAVCEPSALSLFPGQSGTAHVVARPPMHPSVRSGPVPFAVRIASSEDPAGSVVEEGVLDVAAVTHVTAELSPRTGRARGRRASKHRLAVDNRGNTPALVRLAGTDEADLVEVTVRPRELEIAAGSAAFANVRVRAERRFWRGPSLTHRFQVVAHPLGAQAEPPDADLAEHPHGSGAAEHPYGEGVADPPRRPGAAAPPNRAEAAAQQHGAAPVWMDGTLLQEAVIPGWLPKAVALTAAGAVAAAALWFAVLRPVVRDAATSAGTAAAQQELNRALQSGAGAGGAGAGGAGAGAAAASASPAAQSSPTPSPAPGSSGAAAKRKIALPPPAPFAQSLDKANPTMTTPAKHELAITDLVLQNPAGDTGTLTVSRAGQVLVTTRLENFRDYDLHFVTAITVPAGESVRFAVRCQNSGGKACTPVVLISGMSDTIAF